MPYPIPRRANELRASGSGPVTSYFLSAEELEVIRSKTVKPVRSVKQESKPIRFAERPKKSSPTKLTAAEQPRRARMSYKKAQAAGPDKNAVLMSIASGNTIVATEKLLGLKHNTLYYWVKKWDLLGINPRKAREILAKEQEQSAEAGLPTQNFLTPDGFMLSIDRDEGIYSMGWLIIDEEEGKELEKVSTPLPHDAKCTPGGKYIPKEGAPLAK